MTSTTRNRKAPARTTSRGPVRPSASGARPAITGRAPTPRRWLAAVAAAAAAVAVAGGIYAFGRGGGDVAGAGVGADPYVGGDLHVMASIDDRLYVGGHDAAAVSTDGGRTWTAVESLRGADPMGWAQTPDGMLVGGHPGLFRSTDNGATFDKVTGEGKAPDDVHSLGAAGSTAYLASPQAGLLASTDGGATWEPRNTRIGQGFMGTILVDPADPQRLIAPDMANGLVTSSDGGLTWTRLGGPSAAMAAAWDPTDTDRLVAIGMMDSAISADGGATWAPLQVPDGTSAAAFSSDGQKLYAAALDGDTAVTYVSADLGQTWTEV